MVTSPQADADKVIHGGLLAGITAYTIWGLFPFYFKATAAIPPAEFVAHRIIWSVPFGLLIILFRKQLSEVYRALKTPKTVALLFAAAVALALNWGVYIYAIQIDQIFQGSLGYYINPLIYVLVGVIFFEEKLTKLQGLAVLFALIGVSVLTLYGGKFPAIALILAVSFTIYGVIRKYVEIGAMPGLFIETLLLALPALAYLFYQKQTGAMLFGALGLQMDILILLAGPVTVLPLLAFAFAARRLKLSTLGFLQFIGPTMQFMCGLYFGEPFTSAHAICFTFIWLGVIIFCADAYRKGRRNKAALTKV